MDAEAQSYVREQTKNIIRIMTAGAEQEARYKAVVIRAWESCPKEYTHLEKVAFAAGHIQANVLADFRDIYPDVLEHHLDATFCDENWYDASVYIAKLILYGEGDITAIELDEGFGLVQDELTTDMYLNALLENEASVVRHINAVEDFNRRMPPSMPKDDKVRHLAQAFRASFVESVCEYDQNASPQAAERMADNIEWNDVVYCIVGLMKRRETEPSKREKKGGLFKRWLRRE